MQPRLNNVASAALFLPMLRAFVLFFDGASIRNGPACISEEGRSSSSPTHSLFGLPPPLLLHTHSSVRSLILPSFSRRYATTRQVDAKRMAVHPHEKVRPTIFDLTTPLNSRSANYKIQARQRRDVIDPALPASAPKGYSVACM